MGRGSEIDCIGVLAAVGDAFQLPLKDSRQYNDTPDGTLITKMFEGGFIEAKGLLGSILVFRHRLNGPPGHVGICTNENPCKIVHAQARPGFVQEVTVVPAMQRLLVASFDFPEVEN